MKIKNHPLIWGGSVIVLAYVVSRAMVVSWPNDFWAWRKEVVLLSGVIMLAAMATAGVLALRTPWLEQQLGGLDRTYRLHKYLGITAGVMLAVHWLTELSPGTLIDWGWLAPRVKGPKGPQATDLLSTLKGPAKDFGEWAAWVMLALVPLALWKAPYKPWRLVHKAMAVILAMGVFHGLVLLPRNHWLTPVGGLMLVIVVAGAVAAVWSLTGRIGRQRQSAGVISAIDRPAPDTLQLTCRLDHDWAGHAAGQFAFLTLDAGEGAHPFTIASADHGDGEIRFVIKALGDYTRKLAQKVQVGQKVRVEGPYGAFHLPEADGHRQVWVAGGVGVTPFMAWLDALAARGEKRTDVDFCYCVPNRRDAVALDELQRNAERVGVRLHVFASREGERLGVQHPVFSERDQVRPRVWFCGPARLGDALKTGLMQKGFAADSFHHEAFDFR
ncbi:ferric reductase-like transmembrane domain-containing protein [Laribacter hongkongensis]|uniref:Ferric reductase-like transmembrane domain-containing protein n=1 Tax=Laribacter hongkongensis TaxID=168471 RepID=A0ABD4SNW6_9NEIS|nr:ferric reductase-like transmembrane domain-containing protein [Laribacter hongkongensis]MCG9025147.1 ferric reductase-like transmembrane domain-containing protein [Laribacter hongkongensis]MCG9101485.1 ferric reductase-like transmembrane domain-containing protein [Laribacter hongkongensis]MCG9103463.1 ferric reductase-like transmembrane domain-containing protein [Laribacter hongkongensis]MCG9111213.1 ferric reductase-like transmembrane domain-containing protein [Laribacter hongkongensis]MCG